MQLSGIDLNLLVIFDALLTERSVSGAARRVSLSPSGLSHSLGRLRELFDDPLFLRSRSEMVPTPRALALAEPVQAALVHVRAAFEETAPFEPELSQQTFRLSASDDVQVMILPALLDAAESVAPRVRIELLEARLNGEDCDQLSRGDLDLALGQFDDAGGSLHRQLLFETRIVCLARQGHPRVKQKLSLDQYLEEGHVGIDPKGPLDLPFSMDDLLQSEGLARRVVSTVGNLEVAPLVVAQSDLLCTAAEEMVRGTVGLLGLQILDHPLPIPRQRVYAIWHERTHRSPAHRWFRALLLETVTRITTSRADERASA